MRHHPALTANALVTTHGISFAGDDGLASLDRSDAALVALADAAETSRITVVSPGALELACGLIRLGHADVTMVRLTDHPRAGQADIAIIPHVASAGFVPGVASFARRILAPLGTAVFRIDAELSPDETRGIHRQLRQLGFTGIRQQHEAGAVMMRADVPLHGQLQCV